MGKRKDETRKQRIISECANIVADIRYYTQYPYSTWLGRIISKWIISRLKSRLNRREAELTEILRQDVKDASLSIKEGKKKTTK